MKTDSELAAFWRCDLRTIFRWKSEGAPLEDEGKMREWLRERRRIPSGTAEILNESKPSSRPVAPPKPKVKQAVAWADPAQPSGELGAAAALKRLEEDERKLWNRLLALEADPKVDREDVKLCRDAWRKTGDSLRRYELAVEQDRRESGQLLPRAELETLAKDLVVNFILTTRATLEGICPQLAGLPGPGEVGRLLLPAWERSVREAVELLQKRPYEGKLAPAWLIAAVEYALRAHL
jgi:hypothetical protein